MMSASQCLAMLILCAFLTGINGVLHVTIMVYGMWKPPYLQCLAYTAPGFEMGAVMVNNDFKETLHFDLQFVASKDVAYCPDISANFHQIAERYYDMADAETGALAVFYPGCDASTTLADFGREWNILAVNTGTTFANLRNRTIYPTTVVLGPYQYEIYGVMIGKLTAAYKWTSMAVIYDVSGIALAHLLVAQEVRRYMHKVYEYVDVHAFPVDTRENVSFQAIIKEISGFTRVIVLALPVNDAEKFLGAFAESGEPREEYVRICIDFVGIIGSVLSRLQRYSFNSSDVSTALWQSVFLISVCWEHDDFEVNQLKRVMKEETRRVYNATFPNNGEPGEHVITAYASLLLYAQVLNETITTGDDPRDGAIIGRAMLNRTFTFPTVGSLYIDKNGERQNIICMYSLQPELRRFEKVRYFDSATQRLHSVLNVSMNWGTPGNLPPPNAPKCGFQKEKPSCSTMGKSTWDGIISGIVLVAVGLFCAAAVVLRIRKPTPDENWWVVDLHYLSRAVESGSSEISGRSHPYSLKSNIVINAPMNYRGRPVWAKVVQVSRRTSVNHAQHGMTSVGSEFRSLLSEIRSLALRCSKINPLIGIGVAPIRLTYLTALCQRGNLSDLIDEVSLDWGLKCSLIADLIEGVSAIHRTVIRRHGHLRPSKCLIDSRLVLKINEVGLYDTLSELQVEVINPKNFEAIGQSLHNAWVAPELRIDLIESATFASIASRAEPSADVYAVGGLLSYLLQGHRLQKDETLCDFAQSSKEGIPPIAIPVLTTIIYECRNLHPADRPNIWQIKMEIERVLERRGTLLEGLIKRLEDYAVQLENSVALRTMTLKQEMDKCDALLGEMLPRSVLVQLRIGHLVQPQLFHSVTILMTYVAGFDEFVLKYQSSPMEIVMFLSSMFTFLDAICAKFQCYKVETIMDSSLVISGLPVENGAEHAHIMADLSLEIRKKFRNGFAVDLLRLKAGLHSGSCAAGVVGTARPRYCVFGDSVNVTSRLAGSSKPGKVHISYATEALLSSDSTYKIHQRGMTYLKGVGSIMTFWLEG